MNLETTSNKLSSITFDIINIETSMPNVIQQQSSPIDTSLASQSSTTSFTQACQQISNQQQMNIAGSTNQLILNYQNIEQFNYFINNKLLPNLQRIVDERDSYLESIIELEQDKVIFRLNLISFFFF
jgi:hypothetical protein